MKKNFKKTLKGIICGLSASLFLTGCGVGDSGKEKQDDKDAQIIEMQLETEEQNEKFPAEMQSDMEKQFEIINNQFEIIERQKKEIERLEKEIERLTQEMNYITNLEESQMDSKTEKNTEAQTEDRLKEETYTFKKENINYVDEISKYLFGENYNYDTVEELVVVATSEGATDEYLPTNTTQIHWLRDIGENFPELTWDEINKIILNDILGKLHNLKTLYYDSGFTDIYCSNPAEETNTQLYKNVASNKNLEYLHFSGIDFSVKSDEFQKCISKLQNLTTLDIQSCRLGDLNWISPLKNLNTVILISPMTTTDNERITNLDALADCQNLTTVIVMYSYVENIDALYNLPNLTYMESYDNPVGDFQIINGVMIQKDQANTLGLR